MGADDEDRDHATERQIGHPDCMDPLEALYRALADIQIECNQLGAAIRQHDCEDAEIAAGDAFASWLVAAAALRRLDVRARQTGEDVRIARLALRAAHYVLDQLFRRALEQTEAPSLRRLLRRLRLGLAIAITEPPALDTRSR